MNDQQQLPRRWRVTVIEWLSHKAIIEAATAAEAEALAHELWANNGEHEAVKRRAKGPPYGRRKGTPFSRSSSGEARSPQLAQRVAAG